MNLDIIKSNPCKKAGNLKRVRKDVDFWTEDEFNKFINTFEKTNTLQYFGYVMIKFLFYTGLRFSELQALQWSNLDFKNKILKIENDLYYKNKHEWQFDETKNKHSKRDIVLDDDTFNMILEWQVYQAKLFDVTTDSFIFSYDNGIPTNKYFPHHALTRHSKLAKVKRIRLHALRHSHASLLISLDVNVLAIAKRLGHIDVQEVLKTYGHLYPKHSFDVADSINYHKKNKTGSNAGH